MAMMVCDAFSGNLSGLLWTRIDPHGGGTEHLDKLLLQASGVAGGLVGEINLYLSIAVGNIKDKAVLARCFGQQVIDRLQAVFILS